MAEMLIQDWQIANIANEFAVSPSEIREAFETVNAFQPPISAYKQEQLVKHALTMLQATGETGAKSKVLQLYDNAFQPKGIRENITAEDNIKRYLQQAEKICLNNDTIRLSSDNLIGLAKMLQLEEGRLLNN